MPPTRTPTPRWRRSILAGSIAVLTASSFAFTAWTHGKDAATPPVHLDISEAPVSNNGNAMVSFAPVVKKVAPSVVKISVAGKGGIAEEGGPNLPDLGQFFGPQGPFFGQPGGRDPHRQLRAPRHQGVGSGVIVTKDGYVLTNNHVVDGADEIKVGLTDGRKFDGKVIGCDPKTDVAVVKIEAKDLPALQLADSDKIEIGDRVLAVGNPFGIGQTVTSGIVSAKDRATMGLDYEDFIQTDAAINPGNSGGALVDMDGRLIGINTAILSRSGGSQGVGFAVPTNLARQVVDSLVKYGHVERGLLGVAIQDVTPDLAKEFKLDQNTGALVSQVSPDSAADKAGLKSGDIIVEFNGKAVADSRHLKFSVGETAPGASVPVKIIRDGASKTMQVTLKEVPGDKMAAASSSHDSAEDALHGVAVTDLDREARAQLRLPSEVKGAVITEVAPDSAAYDAGLRQGDVITEIDRKPIDNAQQAVAACEKPAEKRTLVKVWSRGGTRYVVVDQSHLG